jgi:acetyl esterase
MDANRIVKDIIGNHHSPSRYGYPELALLKEADRIVNRDEAAAKAIQSIGTQEPDRTVVFKSAATGKGGPASLKLYIFNPPEHKASAKSPAIVFFFGGGWLGGTSTQFFPHCRYLASRGMAAISAEYRVKNLHNTTPMECVKDGTSAIRWIRQHASELGIDPAKLAAGGGSAGGQVAAATGTGKAFQEQGEDFSVSSRPDALVLFNPVVDNGPGGYGHDRVKEYWRKFSPIHNIDKNAPPTVIFLGTSDNLVPVKTAKKYKKIMEAKGRRCDIHLYDGQPHGFFNFCNLDNFTKTLVEADRFLTSLGYLKGCPTLQNHKNEHRVNQRKHRMPADKKA